MYDVILKCEHCSKEIEIKIDMLYCPYCGKKMLDNAIWKESFPTDDMKKARAMFNRISNYLKLAENNVKKENSQKTIDNYSYERDPNSPTQKFLAVKGEDHQTENGALNCLFGSNNTSSNVSNRAYIKHTAKRKVNVRRKTPEEIEKIRQKRSDATLAGLKIAGDAADALYKILLPLCIGDVLKLLKRDIKK